MDLIKDYIKIIILAAGLVLGSAYVSAWSAPNSVAPMASVTLPVNLSNNMQIKPGTFGAGSLLSATALTSGELKNCANVGTDDKGKFVCK